MIEYFIENPKLLSVKFSYDPETTRLIKKIPGAVSHYEYGKFVDWHVPITPHTQEPLLLFALNTYSHIPAHVLKIIIETKRYGRTNFSGSSDIDPTFESLEKEPYVSFMLLHRSVIAFQEKEMQYAADILDVIETSKTFPLLVLCDLPIHWNLACHSRNKSTILIDKSDTEAREIPTAAQIVIVDFDMIERNYWLSYCVWKGLIVDNAHKIKRETPKQVGFINDIARGSERTIITILSSEIEKPADLLPVLEISNKLRLFGGYWSFVTEYCDATRTSSGYDISGTENADELEERLIEFGCLINPPIG